MDFGGVVVVRLRPPPSVVTGSFGAVEAAAAPFCVQRCKMLGSIQKGHVRHYKFGKVKHGLNLVSEAMDPLSA